MALWRSRDTGKRTDAERVAAAGRAGALVELDPPEEPRDWLFPGSDEFYRSIYTALGIGPTDVLAITSAIAGEGKTTTALGLSVAAASDFPERRVLLVELDIEHPVLAADFDVDPSPGLVDCLLSEEPVQSAYRPTFLNNLHLMPAGVAVGAGGRLLRSSRMVGALEAMKRSYDLIVLDGPAVLVNSDALAISDLADGTVFVVRSGVTPSRLVRQGLADINETKLRGIVLNAQRSAVPAWVRRFCGL